MYLAAAGKSLSSNMCKKTGRILVIEEVDPFLEQNIANISPSSSRDKG
jgi:TPP-dependent indolepyruvate ferredoxin oxidoreductase alpha subunit